MKTNQIKNKFTDENGNDLLNDLNINNKLEEFILEISKEISKKRELIIRERLKHITGNELDIVEEANRRFKRFYTNYNGREETIYFNDGSIDGVRLVTFIREELPFNPDKFTIAYEESYY